MIYKRYRISRLDVFGLAAHSDHFDPAASDADFLVDFVAGANTGLSEFFGAKTELEYLLGRAVDLIEPASARNPYVVASINRSRELVYAA